MKTISKHWFSFTKNRKSLGVIVGEDGVTGKRKAYMGIIDDPIIEEIDEQYIKDWGTPVPVDFLEQILRDLEGGK